MYRAGLIFFLILYSVSGSGQSGVVLDAVTKKGIAFATVIGTNNHKGVYTTSSGKFVLSLPENDSLQISCVGYETITKPCSLVKKADTILLYPAIVQLSEIKVSSIVKSKFHEETLGFAGKKSHGLFSGSTGLEFVVFIANKSNCSDCYINKLCYQIKNSGLDSAVAIRLHLYDVAADGSPGTEVLDSNYVVILSGKMNGISAYDISHLKISLPENGIFVGLEWLGAYTSSNTVLYKSAVEPMIALNTKTNEQLTFERSAGGKWKKGDNETLFASRGFTEERIFKEIWNASFGITVLKPKKR